MGLVGCGVVFSSDLAPLEEATDVERWLTGLPWSEAAGLLLVRPELCPSDKTALSLDAMVKGCLISSASRWTIRRSMPAWMPGCISRGSARLVAAAGWTSPRPLSLASISVNFIWLSGRSDMDSSCCVR